MSFESEVTAKLAQLTQAISDINTQSKSINQLTEETVLDNQSYIHTSKNEVSKKLKLEKILDYITGGLEKWTAKVYQKRIGVVNGTDIYILSDTVTLPYNSTDFSTELANNIWIKLTKDIPKAIEVNQTRNYQPTDYGNILFVMADATLIIEPSILPPDFICDVYTETGTLTNAAVNGALTIPLSTSTLAIGKMQTIVRKGNTNVFLIKGENS